MSFNAASTTCSNEQWTSELTSRLNEQIYKFHQINKYSLTLHFSQDNSPLSLYLLRTEGAV